jgi:hypothetical protein
MPCTIQEQRIKDMGVKSLRVAVIDGQGGGIGKTIVERLRKELTEDIDIIALGTNAVATMLMMKAGANEGASGENAVIYNAGKVDIIAGPIGILAANGFMGEMTPAMAAAVAGSPARKVLIPLNRCGIEVAGIRNEPLPNHIEHAVAIIKDLLKA